MSRTLILLFRRDPSRDRQTETIQFEGYQAQWPDGRRVAVGLDAFCKHGTRLLGLGKHLKGHHQKLVKLVCFPLGGGDDALNRIPGYRVRRFFLKRDGNIGRIHFLDGTPTVVTFELGVDERRVIEWVGLDTLDDGEIQWCDIAAVDVNTTISGRGRPLMQAV